jgi:cardiolipin synthase
MPLFNKPRLLPADEFARDAVKKIDRAISRVALVTTTFHADDTLSAAIVDALCAAAERGVIVSVCADAYTYTEPKEFILRSPKRHPVRAYRAIKVERQLKKSGADFRWLGRSSNIGFAGRTHTKWLITDDVVYSFGGVNIDRESFINTDYMIRMADATLADALFSQHLRLLKADRAGHALKSRKISINDSSTTLIDGGLIGDSVIYRRACTLAKEATEITLVSQYCPTGKLNRILKRKKATLYFNHWRRATWMNKLLIQFGMLFTRQNTRYHHKQYLHAKFIIFTMPDGAKVAISGSHNFMYGSVLLGTREIALETRDPSLIKQLEQFLATRVV